MADVFDAGLSESDSDDNDVAPLGQFIVDKVVAHRTVAELQRSNHTWIEGNPNDYRFRVKWVGYSSNEDTWEPPENLKGGRVRT